MPKLGRKFSTDWDRTWKQALAKGVCPIGKCDIKKATCSHLDRYLSWDADLSTKKHFKAFSTGDIEALSGEPPYEVPGAWEFFKQLRQYPLHRDQIGVLVRRFALGMTMREIYGDMGFVSMATLYRRYREALDVLQRRNYGGGKE